MLILPQGRQGRARLLHEGRQEQHEQAIEHLSQAKMDAPASSWLPLLGVILSLILGLAGLVSPATVAQLLKHFVP